MRLFLTAASLVLLSWSASASTIIGLCGTGRSANCGALLNANNSNDAGAPYQDGNYVVYQGPPSLTPGGATSPYVLSTVNQYGPASAWADYNSGKWVSIADSSNPDPGCSPTQNSNTCHYDTVYQISFTIPININPAWVSVTGSWTADDTGHVVVNNTSLISNSTAQGGALPDVTPSCTAPFCGASTQLFTFTLNNSTPGVTFTTGTNTIAFDVNQADDYFDGVVVDSLSAQIPEPGTLGLLAAGFLALEALRRGRKARRA